MNHLDQILEKKREDVRILEESGGIPAFKEMLARYSPPAQDIYSLFAAPGLHLIAEIKKASPSRGVIRENFDPFSLARQFEENGACMLSVLTEPHFFLGKADYIPQIKTQCRLPILRKDFIINPIQIYESKLLGADCILLIQAILTPHQTQAFIELAARLQLGVLLEIHNEAEFNLLSQYQGRFMVGVNNRNLENFHVDIQTASRLLPKIRSALGPNTLVVAESGYNTLQDLTTLEEETFNAALIGEGLATAPEILSFFHPKNPS